MKRKTLFPLCWPNALSSLPFTSPYDQVSFWDKVICRKRRQNYLSIRDDIKYQCKERDNPRVGQVCQGVFPSILLPFHWVRNCQSANGVSWHSGKGLRDICKVCLYLQKYRFFQGVAHSTGEGNPRPAPSTWSHLHALTVLVSPHFLSH